MARCLGSELLVLVDKNISLLRITDFSRSEVNALFDVAARLKKERAAGVSHRLLEGKSLGMIFRKSSTRTRISFEVGMFQLGGMAVFLQDEHLQMKRGESMADTARVFSRYLDGILIRTYDHSEAEELAKEADIPVINALTDEYHPCQILADLFTIKEKKGTLDGVKVVYIGDGNNVANSWLLGAALMGVNITVITPEGYEPDPEIVAEAKSIASQTGGLVETGHDPATGVKGAHVLYTDTWISMGMDAEADIRKKAFSGHQLNEALIELAEPDVMVMHCLPAHRGEEISAGAIDGPHSVVWDEAENRLHIQKAILLKLIGDK
ncbi:Ornithine carbamoyltransferase [hydrothermal vent metagenome]|uniref:ornithine carbamoyltransferase n=1 Tax=hydrothermal vent metagenome TaxID=652676 RepID=A0A3B1C6L7_9ZZZZ